MNECNEWVDGKLLIDLKNAYVCVFVWKIDSMACSFALINIYIWTW